MQGEMLGSVSALHCCLVAAENKEAHGRQCNSVRLDRHSDVSDHDGVRVVEYHRWGVHPLERSQLRRQQDGRMYCDCVVRAAADLHGRLLLEDCPRTENQGKTTFRQPFMH